MIRKTLLSLPWPLIVIADGALRMVNRFRTDHHRFVNQVYSKLGSPKLVVHKGPFAGVKFLPMMPGAVITPKLLGCFETELDGCVDEICGMAPKLLVNIGAAEGFYAVGFAKRLPGARIVCFEMLADMRFFLKRMLEINDVDSQVEIKGECTAENLKLTLSTSDLSIVLCDVEGAEDFLLDPQKVPQLKSAMILVELHEHERPGVTQRLRDRFVQTHEIREYVTRDRTRNDLPPAAASLTDAEFQWAVSEGRLAPQTWFFMTPKNR